jgi:hypothetical protein
MREPVGVEELKDAILRMIVKRFGSARSTGRLPSRRYRLPPTRSKSWCCAACSAWAGCAPGQAVHTGPTMTDPRLAYARPPAVSGYGKPSSTV